MAAFLKYLIEPFRNQSRRYWIWFALAVVNGAVFMFCLQHGFMNWVSLACWIASFLMMIFSQNDPSGI